MNSNILGQNIIKYRELAGMTQSDLGKQLNVSPQAVSRWERGGMPDAAILPRISAVLECTLDDLFSADASGPRQLEEIITRELQRTPPEQQTQRAFQLAWHIMRVQGTMITNMADAFFAATDSYQDTEDARAPANFYFDLDDGLMQAAVTSKCKYVLFMSEPQEGYASMLKSSTDYQKLFALLGKEHRLAVLLIGLTLPRNMLFTHDYVCDNLGISPELVQEVLDELCEYGMLDYRSIQTSGQSIDTYRVFLNPDIIPLLCLAGNLMRDPSTYNLFIPQREAPLLKTILSTGEQWKPASSKSRRVKPSLQHCASNANID